MDAEEFANFKEVMTDYVKANLPQGKPSIFLRYILNADISEDTLTLTVDSALDEAKVKDASNIIEAFAEKYFERKLSLSIKISKKEKPAEAEIKELAEDEKNSEKLLNAHKVITLDRPATSKSKSSEQKISLDPSMTFQSFVVGDNSQFAYNLCLAISKNPAMDYNPCFIYGDSGLGKTHLAQAVGNEIIKNLGMNVVFMSCEQFMDEFIAYTLEKKIDQFKTKFKNVDVLIVDDIQFLEKSEKFQEIFFNIFNVLKDNNKQILCTSDRPISALKKIEKRLSSRIGSGITAELNAPDYETRFAIINSKCRELNYSLDKEVRDFIARNIITNVRTLVSCIKTLNGYEKLTNERISLSTAKEVLKDKIISTESTEGISSTLILDCISKTFKVSTIDIIGKKKTKSFVTPRNYAAYLMNSLTEMSTTEIGIALGGRDHSTIIYAINKVKDAISADKTVKDKIDQLSEMIKRESQD